MTGRLNDGREISVEGRLVIVYPLFIPPPTPTATITTFYFAKVIHVTGLFYRVKKFENCLDTLIVTPWNKVYLEIWCLENLWILHGWNSRKNTDEIISLGIRKKKQALHPRNSYNNLVSFLLFCTPLYIHHRVLFVILGLICNRIDAMLGRG